MDSLEFRVYRVDDPLKFFQQIENPHQFGGRAPAPPREQTLLERIHVWKRGLRAHIRRSLRAQFTESPSAHFESLLPHPAAPAGSAATKGTYYAETPVLNSQQLVLSFVQPVVSRTRWERDTVPIGVKDKGVYLVEAVRHDLRAYTILIVSDAVMVTKVGKGRVVNLMLDRSTGEPIPSAKVVMLAKEGEPGVFKPGAQAQTNSDGVAEIPLGPQFAAHPNDVRIVGRNGGDFAVNAAGRLFFPRQHRRRSRLRLYRPSGLPSRPYRPLQSHSPHALLRPGTPFRRAKPSPSRLTIPNRNPSIRRLSLPRPAEPFTTTWCWAPRPRSGITTSKFTWAINSPTATFEVEEYKKPEYEVRVTPAKTRVLQGETVQATIDSRYYFGEPVSGAKVEWALYRDHYYFPLWYDPEEDVGPNRDDSDDSGDQVAQGEGQLDADGKLNVNIETKVSEHGLDYMYRLEAKVTDQANREITAKAGSSPLMAALS